MVDFESMPKNMRALPVDSRGYPVPWFVAWEDGKPEFRAMDPAKFLAALRHKLCWVCGCKLHTSMCFVAGPMCGINRTSSEPPSCPACARWSAQNCPFLANPRMVRREDERINNNHLREASAGKAITRNPGVAMLWFTRQYEVFDDGRGRPLLQMGTATAVEWWCKGKPATREEVQLSVDEGLPALEAIARTQEGAMAELRRYINRFEKWLPAA